MKEKPGRSTGGEAARARRADLVGLERRDRAAEGRQRIAGRSAAPERPAPAPRPQSPVPCCRPCGRGCSGGRPNLEVPALRGPPGRAVRRGRAAGADAPSGPGLNASKLGRRRGLAGAARKDRAARRRGAPPIISVMGRGRSGGPTPSASSAPCRPSTRPGATSCPGPRRTTPTPGSWRIRPDARHACRRPVADRGRLHARRRTPSRTLSGWSSSRASTSRPTSSRGISVDGEVLRRLIRGLGRCHLPRWRRAGGSGMARVGRQADGVYEPTERRRGRGSP